jgi:hypothetical protein
MTWDLSTSGKCGTNYVIPEVRSGHVRYNTNILILNVDVIYIIICFDYKIIMSRIRILWSEPLPVDLTMLMYCEFPSTLYLNKDTASTSSNFKVTSSYTAR